MSKPVPICFIDTETTSLDVGRRRAWEVAIIKRQPGGAETEHQFYVDAPLVGADQQSLRIGGYYDRHPYGRFISGKYVLPFDREPKPSPLKDLGDPFKISTNVNAQHSGAARPFLTEYAAAVTISRLTHGAMLVGANAAFDAYTWEQLLREHGLAAEWHYDVRDVKSMTVGYTAGRLHQYAADNPEGPVPSDWQYERLTQPAKSDWLAAMVDLPPIPEEDRHTALGDARWVRDWFDKLTRPETAPAAAEEPEPVGATS